MLLGTLECVEPLAEFVGQRFVELVEVEVRREVRRLLPAGIVAVVLVDSMSESVLNFTPFRGEQLPGAFCVHQCTFLSRPRERLGRYGYAAMRSVTSRSTPMRGSNGVASVAARPPAPTIR
jgi:hypothetical protein